MSDISVSQKTIEENKEHFENRYVVKKTYYLYGNPSIRENTSDHLFVSDIKLTNSNYYFIQEINLAKFADECLKPKIKRA